MQMSYALSFPLLEVPIRPYKAMCIFFGHISTSAHIIPALSILTNAQDLCERKHSISYCQEGTLRFEKTLQWLMRRTVRELCVCCCRQHSFLWCCAFTFSNAVRLKSQYKRGYASAISGTIIHRKFLIPTKICQKHHPRHSRTGMPSDNGNSLYTNTWQLFECTDEDLGQTILA